MSSPINFSGLVSGLDTKSIVQALLQQYQQPVKLLQNQQSTEQKKLQAWQDLNTKLQALQTAASSLSLESSIGAKSVNFSGASGTFATGSATADAVNQSFTLQIDQLATQTTMVSTAGIGTAINGADLVVNNPKTSSSITTGTFTVNGQVVTVTGGSTFNSVMADVQTALQNTTGSALPSATVGGDNKLHLNLNGAAGTIQLGSAADTSNFLSVTKLGAQPAASALDSTGPIGIANPTAKLNTVLSTGTDITGTDVVVGNPKLAATVTAGTFTINGSSVTINAGDDFNTVFAAINAATGGDVTASIVNNEIQLTSASNTPITLGAGGDTSNFLSATFLSSQPSAATITSGSPIGVNGAININGATITYNSQTDTLATFLARINSSSAGVSAVYDASSDTVTLTSNKTGNLDIAAADSSGSILQALNLNTNAAHHLGLSAKYEINGGAAQYSLTNTVNDIEPNVDITFTATTPSALTVTVSQNTGAAAATIQTFVQAYNSVVDTINQDTAYDPNTKTAGIFLGDSSVDNLKLQLDEGLFISNGAALGLDSSFQTMDSIGLSTGAIGSTPGTTEDLQLDSTKLQNALQQDPAGVTKLVTTVFGNMNKTLMDLTAPGGFVDAAVQSENSEIQDLQSQINDQNDFISAQSDFLTNEFSQLEGQLAQLQTQSAIGASALSSFSAPSASSSGSSLTSQLLGSTGSTGSTSSGA